MTSLPSPRGASVLRAAAFGGIAGLMLGGLGLLGLGVKAVFVPADCTHLSPQECQLLHETDRDLGRVQTLSGGALVALGAALFALTRPRPPTAPDDSSG
ncbi:hypothetical protein HMI49_29055 [Corallococcus exercitus]|uniref:Uncharacterized protein n=1 Tax=Corallococcus exercitus TaxID=2316736 RepID=A0A7Y4NTT4_9BACT|nr:hypothetical protein [Corallococcus exercitus]NOK37250.1 hypothetical protein [Corallococcus exercitus]